MKEYQDFGDCRSLAYDFHLPDIPCCGGCEVEEIENNSLPCLVMVENGFYQVCCAHRQLYFMEVIADKLRVLENKLSENS